MAIGASGTMLARGSPRASVGTQWGATALTGLLPNVDRRAGGGNFPGGGDCASALGSALEPGLAAFPPAAPLWDATQRPGLQAPALNASGTKRAQTPAQFMTTTFLGCPMVAVRFDPTLNLADGSSVVF